MDSRSSHLIGGFFGGLTSSVILQPFDFLKTRVQQNHGASLRETINQLNSWKTLWRGTLPSAIRTSVGSALYLSTLNVARSALSKSRNDGQLSSSALPKLSTQLNLMTGFLARAAVGLLTMPITIVKVRYESTLYQYTSLRHAFGDIYKNEGLKGFVRGSGATIARDAPYAGIYVGLYEWWKVALGEMVSKKGASLGNQSGINKKADDCSDNNDGKMFNISTSALINSTSALLAASLATTITAPFDTIKTRMQLQPQKFISFSQTAVRLVKNEGSRSLFDGLGLRLGRKALSAGIAWGIYEEIVKFVIVKSNRS